MGWLYSHKPAHVGAAEFIRQENFNWWEKCVIKHATTTKGVFCVTRVAKADIEQWDYYSKIYVPENDEIRSIVMWMIKHERNPSDGYNFGRKDVTETMGPYDCEAPASILRAASPLREVTEGCPESLKWAAAYRERCWAKIAAQSKRRAIKEGDRVRLPAPVRFTTGFECAEFVATFARVSRRRGQSLCFRPVDGGGYYRLRASDLAGAVINP